MPLPIKFERFPASVREKARRVSGSRPSYLRVLLEAARDAYYNGGDSILTDEEFDSLEESLRQIDPQNPFFKKVGAPPVRESAWEKVTHLVPMGSLSKVKDAEELGSWLWVLPEEQGIHAYLESGAVTHLCWSEKLDGISISLRYERGELTQAVTRGDGVEGEDILRNVRRMRGVKNQVPGFTGHIRGEIVLLKSIHQEHLSEYANPRNAASGIAKRLYDADVCELLSVKTYQVLPDIARPDLDATKKSEFEWLEERSFDTPQWGITHAPQTADLVYPITDLWERYSDTLRSSLDYEIDGLVVEVNDLDFADQLGEQDGRPKGSVAFKFPSQVGTTTLNNVRWDVGNSGRVTPIAEFDRVHLSGVNVVQANLHNFSKMVEMGGFSVGDEIEVSRRGDVIPKVEKNLSAAQRQPFTRRMLPPLQCPSCGTELVIDGKYLRCPAKMRCPAQRSGSVKRWVEKIGLKDVGDGLIDALVQDHGLTEPADLYGLTSTFLATVDLSQKSLGQSLAKKAVDSLHSKKTLRLADIVGSLGIELCSRSVCEKIVEGGYDTLDKMRMATVPEIARIPGMGERKASEFVLGLKDREAMIDNLLAAGITVSVPKTGGKLNGKSVCFTGFRNPSLEERIKDAGGTVKSSVSKRISYCVSKTGDTSSTKAVKALGYGIPVLSIAELEDLL